MKELHRTAKQDKITGGATSITSSNLTASRALVSDGSGKVAVSAVTSTELGHLDGVTSNIQTQLNAKAASSDLTAHIDDTKHITADERTKWDGKQDAINGAASSIVSKNLTASMVMVTDADGKVAASSSITTSELSALNNYLVGEKGNIKTRFEAVERAVSDINDDYAVDPDWANSVELENGTDVVYTVPKRGFFMVFGSDNGSCKVSIGNFSKQLSNGAGNTTIAIPVATGDAITYTATEGAYFIPYK